MARYNRTNRWFMESSGRIWAIYSGCHVTGLRPVWLRPRAPYTQFICYCYHQWLLGHYHLAGLGVRLAYEAEPVGMDDNLTCSSSLRSMCWTPVPRLAFRSG